MVLKRLGDTFAQVIGIPIPSDVNEVMVGMVTHREDISRLASPDSPLTLLSSPAVKQSFQLLIDAVDGGDGDCGVGVVGGTSMCEHWERSLSHAVLL